MKFTQAIKMAMSAIAGNKMRSFLTMLGIIIGVISVIMLMSVGQGATSSVTDQISSLGSNILSVSVMGSRDPKIKTAELDELEGNDGIAYIAPVFSTMDTVKGGTNTTSTTIEGSTPDYAQIRDYNVSSGRFIVDSDIEWRNAVAVVGTDVADELFSTQNVVGDSIVINGRKFEIVGVLESKGSSSSSMTSDDNKIIIPFSTAQRLFQSTTISSFYASAESADTVDQAQAALESFMLKKTGDEESYRVFNQSSILDTLNETTSTLALMLGGIAGIALLVGGIGIMNIMLVSVTERTKEIGVRKAIGAQRWDIMSQFLIEAIVLSLVGGIVGVIIGYLGTILLGNLLSMSLSVSSSVTIIALAFSAAVGIVFGIYPASKASKLRPIEALHYE